MLPRHYMLVVCAWCEAEGRPQILVEREPLEDRTSTHTVCNYHRAALYAELRRLDQVHDADAVA